MLPIGVTHDPDEWDPSELHRRAVRVLKKMKEEEKKWIFKTVEYPELRIIRKIGVRRKKKKSRKGV